MDHFYIISDSTYNVVEYNNMAQYVKADNSFHYITILKPCKNIYKCKITPPINKIDNKKMNIFMGGGTLSVDDYSNITGLYVDKKIISINTIHISGNIINRYKYEQKNTILEPRLKFRKDNGDIEHMMSNKTCTIYINKKKDQPKKQNECIFFIKKEQQQMLDKIKNYLLCMKRYNIKTQNCIKAIIVKMLLIHTQCEYIK